MFIERLQSYTALPTSHVTYLGNLYGFSSTTNTEVRSRFYELALLDPLAPGVQVFAKAAAKWVTGSDGTGIIKGRMKFCRPVFRAVYRVDPSVARDEFVKYKLAFHPIARRLIEKVVYTFQLANSLNLITYSLYC